MNKKILITAYDVDPYRGSESATGWKFPYYLAKNSNHLFTVVTRKNNRDNIEDYFNKNPECVLQNLTFEYFDLNPKYCFWKKGSRGSSIYYYLWQYFIIKKISKLDDFDIYHGLNFHTDAFPSFLWKLKTQSNKIVWGPISHHESIPFKFIKKFSFKEVLKDRLRYFIKNIFWKFDPFLKLMQKKSDLILLGHSKVQDTLSKTNAKTYLVNQIAEIEDNESLKEKSEEFVFVFMGRLVPLKGVDLAIEAFIDFERKYTGDRKFKLQIIGKGPLKSYCQQQSKLSNNIEMIDWVDKDKVANYLNSAAVFLFPSHEGAGMVVAEAGMKGLPIVCINNYGPGEILGFKEAKQLTVSTDLNRQKTIQNISVILNRLISEDKLYMDLSSETKKFFKDNYTWGSKAKLILALYEDLYD